jgi:acetyl esterase/lipase
MSHQQRAELDTLLRGLPLDLGGDLAVQRPLFEQLMTAHPLPDDVAVQATELGGVPATVIDVEGVDTSHVMLYLHGGAYALGSASAGAVLASAVARHAGMRAISLDYRLAPEHPFPAAVDDALAAYRALLAAVPAERIVVAGESAGAGLAVTLMLTARDAGLPLPRAGALLSPWADLTLATAAASGAADVDPALTVNGLRRRAVDYLGDTPASHPLASPALADLTGLPPLLIEVGSHEILRDDAIELTRAAARAHVQVSLTVTAGVPHVFPAFADVLDEGRAALERIGPHLAASTPTERALTR